MANHRRVQAGAAAMTIFTESITILRPTRTRGEYGGFEESWDNPTEIPVETPVSIQPTATTEDENHTSEMTEESYTGFSPPGHLIEELRHRDRIRVNTWPGQPILEVTGKPKHWRSILVHSEFNLEVLNGTRR